MAVNLSPVGGVAAQFFDNNGDPLSGGKLYTYAAGTTTPLATYTTSAGNVPHTNPIILDSAGRVPGGEIWLTNSASYKVTIKTSADVLVGSYDEIIDLQSALYPKIASFGSATVDVLYRLGKNYESAGTVEKTETRPFLHDYRPLGTAQGGTAVFSTDGANLFIGPGAGNFTMTPLDVPPDGIDRNLQCSHNLGIGIEALGQLTIGYKNVGIGVNAFRKLTTGHGNSALGRDAGHELLTGISNTFVGFTAGFGIKTGNNNVCVGISSAYNNEAGTGNVSVGRRAGFSFEAGDNNTLVGNEAGDSQVSGSHNTIIGAAVAGNGITTGENSTIIGSRITGLENVSGQVVIGSGDGIKYLQTGTLSTSQARLDLVGREVTPVNLAATDGQADAGSSLLLRSSASVNNAVTQVVFQSRVDQPFSRIVSWGGATPNISLITNNVETARWNSLGDFQQKVNPTAAAMATNSTMTFALTSDTALQVRVRGTDGVTRSVTLTLA